VTHDEIMNTPAGKEIDALINKHVMGVERIKRGGAEWWQDHYTRGQLAGEPFWYLDAPSFSSDIEAAWEVVAAMEEKGEWFRLSNVIPNSDVIVYEVSFGTAYACEDSAPLAICRAALLAVLL
jgi:hypothetical protein